MGVRILLRSELREQGQVINVSIIDIIKDIIKTEATFWILQRLELLYLDKSFMLQIVQDYLESLMIIKKRNMEEPSYRILDCLSFIQEQDLIL